MKKTPLRYTLKFCPFTNLRQQKGNIMSELIIKCPHCANDLSIDPAWLGMELECPLCHRNFTAQLPQQAPEAPVRPFIPQNNDIDEAEAAYKKQRMIKLGIKCALGVIAVIIGIVIYAKVTAVTPESVGGNWLYAMTQKRANRDRAFGMQEIVKADFFPIASGKENFFYRNVSFTKVSLRESGHEQYAGTISFRSKGKEISREVFIDRSKSFTNYYFKVDYKNNTRHLDEDSDLLFELAQRIDKSLSGWTVVSAKSFADGLLICTISKDGKNRTVRLNVKQVKGEDNINRIWIDVTESK